MPNDSSADAETRGYPDAVVDAFTARYGRQPEVVVRAPGRVSLLGAHVDYSEGWVITAAIDRAVWLAAASTSGARVQIEALDFDDTADLDLDHLPPPLPERGGQQTTWTDYPAGVAWALAEAGRRPPAMDVTFGGDVPIGAGVSSSAAVEMAFLLAWEALLPADADPLAVDGAARARLGMLAENGYLGVQSGIMDQFSSLHGAAGSLVFLDCRSLEHELVPLPDSARLLVADSGVRRRLVDLGDGNNYNDRRQECLQAVELLRETLPGIRTLRDVSPRDFELHSHRLPMALRRRARHAIEECQRVHEGAEALRRGDLETFGRLIRQSHLSSRDLYEVSIPETDLLAASAWAIPGCYGARLVGGGFGGCVMVLAESAAAESIRRAMVRAFEDTFDRTPEIFTCAVADGARAMTRDQGTPDPSRQQS